MSAASPDLNALGYFDQGAGISNQKLALLGLFITAQRHGPKRIVLPDVTNYDVSIKDKPLVPFEQVFDLARLTEFAALHGIDLVRQSPTVFGHSFMYFTTAAETIAGLAKRQMLSPDDFVCDYFRHLVPLIAGSDLLRGLGRRVFNDMGIRIVLQLRIEKDWKRYAQSLLMPELQDQEDYAPSFQRIVQKVKASLRDWTPGIYVTCDESDLPVSKEEIRHIARREHGVELLWKSDLLGTAELAPLSPLTRSLLDFEMAVRAPIYVGLTRSTFSNMAAFEKYSRTRQRVTTHYIYDAKATAIWPRIDNGAGRSPYQAITGNIDDDV
jgi:hypothetical protein